ADLEGWTLCVVGGASRMLPRLPSVARRLLRIRTRHGGAE
ncbi:protein-methionine-sulfoxide reductase heme-binding subunit MsrQ, partial [Pseudomonas aeruginosa]